MVNFGGSPKCPVCAKSVYFNERLRALGKDYHKACFKCTQCKTTLQYGKQEEHNEKPYCPTCYRKKYGPKGYGFGNTLTETGIRAGGRPLSTASVAPSSHKRRSKKNQQQNPSIPEKVSTHQSSTASSKGLKAKRNSSRRKSSSKRSSKSLKPVKVELKAGKQWIVEGASKGHGVIEVNVTSIAQTVYIYGAKEATVVVNGKCNSIAVDKCSKSKVLVDSVLATVEISNSKRMQVQVREFVPSLSIDTTDGCLVYLSSKCTENPDFSITAAKSSEMNISFPSPEDSDDYLELPLPEQFRYTIDATGEEPLICTKESDLYSS